MGTMTLLEAGRAFTRADLDAMPDDGRRHELIDGALIVTPAPIRQHQRIVVRLVLALSRMLPEGFELLVAPFDVALGDDTIMQPDVLVARTSDFTERDLPVAPLLAIEVLSPSTRHIDLGLKKARYEAAGSAGYWVIDPKGPRILAWALVDGRYVEVADAVGEAILEIDRPFPVTLVPAELG